MTKAHEQRQRLIEVSGMVGILAEKMMTAYIFGSQPSEADVMAFCRGVLLLGDYAVPLPPFVEDVIARLQAEDASPAPALPPAKPLPQASQRSSVFERLLRPLSLLLAGCPQWA